MDLIQISAALTGLYSVWLLKKENIITWPIGILNCLLLAYSFFTVKLYADFSLQIIFIVLSIVGWFSWAKQNNNKISRVDKFEKNLYFYLSLIIWSNCFVLLTVFKGNLPWLDSITATLSIVATILLNKKKLETWYVWILVDVISIPMYLLADLPYIALLYIAYLALAITNLKSWKQSYEKSLYPNRTSCCNGNNCDYCLDSISSIFSSKS